SGRRAAAHPTYPWRRGHGRERRGPAAGRQAHRSAARAVAARPAGAEALSSSSTRSHMAQVILGIGSSHSPMLSTPYEGFAGHAERDRANRNVPDFDALVREKTSWIGRELRPEVTRARHEATQTALTRLSRVLAETEPDVLVVIGDDQGEWF